MNTLQIAYRILYQLEHGDRSGGIGSQISPAALDVSEGKWLEVMQALLEEGYISGVQIKRDIFGNQSVDVKNIRITLKGAEYLSENGVMKRFAKAAADVITILKP